MCGTCTRRSVLAGGLSVLFAGQGVRNTFAEADIACAFDSDAHANFTMQSTSGDSQLDNALISELRNIIKLMLINPGFKYIDARNAFALKSDYVSGTRGTILLGLPLIKELMKQEYGGVSVAGLCAHECGHIYQYNSAFYDRLKGSTPILLELHADFAAGYYLAKRKGFAPDKPELFAKVLLQGGGYDYFNPKFHGSPGQRVAAMDKGYKLSSEGLDFRKAMDEAERYVRVL